MIDTAQITTCKNPSCGKPVHQLPGHRRREYCNDTCKQTAYRLRQKGITNTSRNSVTNVDDRQATEKATEIGSTGNEVQIHLERAVLERRFLDIGHLIKFPQLKIIDMEGGYSSWKAFSQQADDARLVENLHHAETYLDIMLRIDKGQHQRRITELEQRIVELEQEIATLKERSSKRKKADEPLPLPADLMYWRQFANLHGVSQNEVTEAVSRGYIHLRRGSWKVGDDYITQALDTQGQHEFWVQFHALDTFRTCDTCPH